MEAAADYSFFSRAQTKENALTTLFNFQAVLLLFMIITLFETFILSLVMEKTAVLVYFHGLVDNFDFEICTIITIPVNSSPPF